MHRRISNKQGICIPELSSSTAGEGSIVQDSLRPHKSDGYHRLFRGSRSWLIFSTQARTITNELGRTAASNPHCVPESTAAVRLRTNESSLNASSDPHGSRYLSCLHEACLTGAHVVVVAATPTKQGPSLARLVLTSLHYASKLLLEHTRTP